MKEFNPSNPNDDDIQMNVLRQLLDAPGELIKTHSRFNLSIDDESLDVVQLLDDGSQNRFLITSESRHVTDVEDRLTAAGIQLLSRVESIEDHIVYEVPVQAKPLANERLFPDKESTETYVSDVELSTTLGWLWGSIYKATQHIPADSPLSHTGMLEFSTENGRLFPIPPYNWVQLSEADDAKQHFEASMSEELLLLNPMADYSKLIAAASDAWERA